MTGTVSGDALVQLCAFSVGSEEYAVDLMRIREIIKPLPVTPVPQAPEPIEGVVNLRGEIIPVIDVRRKFGVPVQPSTPRSRLLVVNITGRLLALAVDAVVEVLRIPRSSIRAAPELVDVKGPRLFLGVCGGASSRSGRSGESNVMAPARAGRRWTPPVSSGSQRGTTPKLRLLLNVKALLERTTPGEIAAARELADAERSH
jgi:purine-binding chemotaxis protein CheW